MTLIPFTDSLVVRSRLALGADVEECTYHGGPTNLLASCRIVHLPTRLFVECRLDTEDAIVAGSHCETWRVWRRRRAWAVERLNEIVTLAALRN